MIDEVPLLDPADSMNPYFEVIISAQSRPPPGGEPTAVCSGCGRETIDGTKRQLVMHQSMWRGQSVFFLATTLYIVITDPLRQALEDLGATNVRYVSYGAA